VKGNGAKRGKPSFLFSRRPDNLKYNFKFILAAFLDLLYYEGSLDGCGKIKGSCFIKVSTSDNK